MGSRYHPPPLLISSDSEPDITEVDSGVMVGVTRPKEGEELGGRAKRYLFQRRSRSREVSQPPEFGRQGTLYISVLSSIHYVCIFGA